MNGTTRRLRFLVIGPASFLKERTRVFWADASMDLLGPLAATDFAASIPAEGVDGAIIDIRYEADILLQVIEYLQARQIPALLASPMSLTTYLTGGFVLSRNADDMAAIVRHLVREKNPTLH